MGKEITLPFEFVPRPYQIPLMRSMDSGFKRAVYMAHRRSGKDKTCLNIIIKKMYERVGTYFYIFPTYNQGRKVLWDGIDKEGKRYISHFPKELIAGMNEVEMRIELKNGSAFQIIGSDNIDSLVGTNPIGIIFSEYSLQSPRAWDYLRPILLENGGWAIFNFTPRGKNHAFDLYEMAMRNPQWYVEKLTISDTGVLTQKDMEEERMAGMTEDMIQQEYFCSFTAAIMGSYYWKEYDEAERSGRFGNVPYDPGVPVHTVWDLGIGDATAIGFYQVIGQEVHKIDYYEASGEGFAHFAQMLQAKRYYYGKHFAPHDIRARELGTGKTRLETASSLGIDFEVVPNIGIENGIDAARMLFRRLWVDSERCAPWLKLIPQYTKEYDDERKIFKDKPLHDWTCFTGDTKVLTHNGMKQIMDVLKDDLILTKKGWLKQTNLIMARRNASLVEVSFKDGTKVKCTPDHLFLTEQGWRFAKHLTKNTLIQSSLTPLHSISMVASIVYGQMRIILREVVKSFTEWFGALPLVRFLLDVIFTTGMAIQKIIVLIIWNVYLRVNISHLPGKEINQMGLNILAMQPEKQLQIGMDLRKENFGTVDLHDVSRHGKNGSEKIESASSARRSSNVLSGLVEIFKNTVIQIVRPLIIEGVQNLEEKADVWDITVPIEHMFSLSNGALVHNCHGADEFRYAAVVVDQMKSGSTMNTLYVMIPD